jgi:hypothetical protein
MEHDEQPEKRGPLRFDPENRWWKIHAATLRESAALARGKYLVGCPDLIENVDILASLRGMSALFLDMLERPEWVSEKLHEINQAYFEGFDRIYEIIRLEDGSAAFEAYKSFLAKHPLSPHDADIQRRLYDMGVYTIEEGKNGFLGVLTVHLLTTTTRLKRDAALGLVLSSFYALGVVLYQLVVGDFSRALAHGWKPCALAAFTTALGLMSLNTSNIVPIRNFAASLCSSPVRAARRISSGF